MIRRHAAAWALVATLVAPAAAVQVVATSGMRADGLGISTFETPQLDGHAIWFRSTSTSVTLGGSTFGTGDPLPGGVAGTIEEIVDAETAGARAAMLLSATGPALSYGIFLFEGGTALPIVTTAPGDPTRLRSFVMNQAGDVAYTARNGRDGDIRILPRGAGASLSLVVPDRQWRTLRALVIDDAGGVAWLNQRYTDVWRWDAAGGTRLVVSGRRARHRGGGASPIAIEASGGLVVAQRDVVQRWAPDGSASTLLATAELVAGFGITRIYGDVGFLDDGAVTVRVHARHAPAPYVCIAGSVKTFCGLRGRPSAGSRAAITSTSAIFRHDDDGLAAIVRPGLELPGVGTLTDVPGFAVTGGAVTFLGALADGRFVLARATAAKTSVLAADGPIAGNRTMQILGYFAARGTTVLANVSILDSDGAETSASGLALVRARGSVQPVVGSRADARFGSVGTAVFAGGTPFLLSDDSRAVATIRNRRLRVLVVAGKGAARNVASLFPMAASGSGVVFGGTDLEGMAALYELRAGRFRRVLALPAVPWALDGDSGGDAVLAIATTPDGGTTYVTEVWTVHDGGATTVAVQGDATPLGTLTSIDDVALGTRTVVVAASVAGVGPHRALLAYDR